MIGTGLHLMIDGLLSRPIGATETVDYVLEVAKAIDMTIIHGPVANDVVRGISVHTIIATSHIFVTTHGADILIDVFSCVGFDRRVPIRLAVQRLGMREGATIRGIYRAGTGDRQEATTVVTS